MKTVLGVFIALCWGACDLTAGPVAFYVAPDGRNDHAGTLAEPFATFERARDAIRVLKRAQGLPDGGVTVWLRGGEYALKAPLVLTPEDSG